MKEPTMKAIEFQSHLENGKIPVPADSGLQEGQDVRVLILVKDDVAQPSVEPDDRRSVWKRTEGAWQGELVREAQGDYPIRLEMES